MDKQVHTPDERPSKRPRSAIACHRCKQRKQRCDNAFPSCANCIGASQSCSYDTNVYPADYVHSLESQIAGLERRLESNDKPAAPDHMPRHQQSYSPASAEPTLNFASTRHGGRHLALDNARSHPSTETFNAGEHLEIGAGFVALSSNAYLGTSSGFPLAKIVQSAINISLLKGVQGGTQDGVKTARRDNRSENSSNPAGRDDQRDEISRPKADMPKGAMGERLVQAYLTKLHPKHPFLSPKRIHRLNERRFALRSCRQLTADNPGEERLDYFILHMVYAIGARYLQLAEDYDYCPPEAHYAAAIEDIDTVFDIKSIENLEGMLLLAIYQLRSSSGPGIWSTIGVTMRHCLDCGLHRKSNLPNLLDQRRKRLFWTVYMLERSVARTLGRPCCVTDREIDVDLPANVAEDIENEADLSEAIEEASRNPGQITSLSPALHIFRIQQLESKIHYTVYRVDRPTSDIPSYKIARLRDALQDWKNQIRTVVSHVNDDASSPYITTSYHMLQYHKAILLLLLPLLPSLPATHPDFRLCADAAGQICQIYKRLHDQQYISYSLLALHANFVAGLTMVYCFWMDKTIFDWKFSSDVRACSTVLYIIAERWSAARKVRNAFESLVQATIEGGYETRTRANNTQLETASMPMGQTGCYLPPAQDPVDMFTQTGSVSLPESNDVWDLLGTVLDDGESSWRWAQEGFYNATSVFPEYGWTLS